MEINPRIYAFIFIFIVIFGFIFVAPSILFPHAKDNLKKNNTTNNTIIVYKDRIVTVTPTPDGHTYFAGEYTNGTRMLKRPYSFIRYDVLGQMDMKVTTIVYDYMFFQKLHYFDPTTYKYIETVPSNSDNQYLLVFVYTFMDTEYGDDTRMWAFNRSCFRVFDGKTAYQALSYPFQLRFRELENTFTFDNTVRVQAYKSFREYSSNSEYAGSAGEYNDEIYYLRGGQSNAIDGFLIFEIPKKTKVEDIKVLAQFYAFGSSQWVLKL